MKIRLINAKIAQFSDAQDAPAATLLQGELQTENDRITYVGPSIDMPAQDFDRVIDCKGGVLLPGFKNAHTHSAMTFLRSLADDMPLDKWLSEQVWPNEAKLTPDDIRVLLRLAVMEYVMGGQTAMCDMYYFRDATVEECINMGFRTVISCGVNDFGGTAAETEAEYHRYNNASPLIRFMMGLHGEYTTKESLIQDMVDLTLQLKEPFFAHIAETRSEVDGCLARYGMGPLEKFDSMGAFTYGGGGFHMVHLNDREIDICAQKGLYAVTCPGSNTKLASGIAPVCTFLEKGIPVAIGTDGAASNNCLDFFREMFLVTGLQKLARKDASACDALQVLKMACVNGARAMGLPQCDGLAPGKQADLVLLDLHRPQMQPENNILKNIVYSGSRDCVQLTMVAGRILYEKGNYFIGMDPEKIYADANAIVRRFH